MTARRSGGSDFIWSSRSTNRGGSSWQESLVVVIGRVGWRDLTVDELRGHIPHEIMHHRRAEPDVLHLDDLLRAILGIVLDRIPGQILTAPLPDSLSRLGAFEDEVGLGKTNRGKDEVCSLAFLPHHG